MRPPLHRDVHLDRGCARAVDDVAAADHEVVVRLRRGRMTEGAPTMAATAPAAPVRKSRREVRRVVLREVREDYDD